MAAPAVAASSYRGSEPIADLGFVVPAVPVAPAVLEDPEGLV